MRLLLLASLCLLEGSRSTQFLIETVNFSNGPDNISGNDEVVVKESGSDYGEDTEEEEEQKSVINDNRVKKDSIDMEASFQPHHFKTKSRSKYRMS